MPHTVVTNDPCSARRFAARHAPVLDQPLREGDYPDAEGRPMTVWIEDGDPRTSTNAMRRRAGARK